MVIQELYRLFQQYPVVTTDSRYCPPHSIFFALKGEHFDGNEFIEQALLQGCSYAISDKGTGLPSDDRVIHVTDSLKTLQELAGYHRKQLKTPVIAITGTNGKTTTKELVAAVLASQYNVLYTKGNLNNHIGVPLTLLQLRPEHEFAVIEMGANHPGEIRMLCSIAQPDYGLITNVGKAHLEGFGSFEGVIRTKGELFDFLRLNKGRVFVNQENFILKDLSEGMDVTFYGQTTESAVWGETTEPADSFLSLCWHREKTSHNLSTQLVGSYNLENVLAAITIAVFFGVETQAINRSIQEYRPQNNRSQEKKTARNRLIIDAYNANPTSMLAALDNFISIKGLPKMVLLGDMNELGIHSSEEHQKIVNFLEKNCVDRIILCGEHFYACQLKNTGWQLFRKTSELLNYLQSENISGYHILIKGSRGNQLEKTVEYL